MTKEAIRRAVRRATTGAVWTERDLYALELLAWAGVLATRHFSPLVYPSRRVAERRLRALFDLGLLRAKTPGLSKDTIFVLAPGGERVLEDARDLEQLRRASFPRAQKLEHCLAIRDVFVACLSVARSRGHEVEEAAFETDDALPALRAAGLVPDLVVTFGGVSERARGARRLRLGTGGDRELGTAPAPLLVECDLGHERRGVFEAKLTKYEQYLAVATGRLLVVATTERRVTTVANRFAGTPGRVVAVVRAELMRGVEECTRDLFALTVRTVRTPIAAQVPSVVRLSAADVGAFRVIRREVDGRERRG